MQDEISEMLDGLVRIRKSLRSTQSTQEAYDLLQETGKLMGLPWTSYFRNVLDLESEHTVESARMSGLPDELFQEARKRHYGFKIDPRTRSTHLPFLLLSERLTSSKYREDTDHRAMYKRQSELGIKTILVMPIHHPTGMVGNIFWSGPLELSTAENLLAEATGEIMAFSYEFIDKIELVLDEPDVDQNITHLTVREIECLTHVANGKHVPEIAKMISISQTTIRYHLGNCRDKLGAGSTAHAVGLATQLGLLGTITPRSRY